MPAWRMTSTASSLLKAFTPSRLRKFTSGTIRYPTSRLCLLPHKATHAAILDAFYIIPMFRSIRAFDHAEWEAVVSGGEVTRRCYIADGESDRIAEGRWLRHGEPESRS
jgi:hypothetical protein